MADRNGGPREVMAMLQGRALPQPISEFWTSRKRGQADDDEGMKESEDKKGRKGQETRQIKRNLQATEQCRKRDHDGCVVTKGMELDVAHIFPFSLYVRNENGRLRKFWSILAYFWPEDKVEAWRKAVNGNGDTPKNMMCLCPCAHRFFGKTLFALKPVKGSEADLTVQFFWLSRTKDRTKVPLTENPTLSVSNVRAGQGLKLYNTTNDEVVKSGDFLTMRTDDPIQRPLPTWEILELQWNLQRVAAMSL